MSSWTQFLASAGVWDDRVTPTEAAPGRVTIATMRADGWPRLDAAEVWVADDQLVLALAAASETVWGLLRDPRCAVHWCPGEGADQVALSCRLREVTDERADAARRLFEVDVVEASSWRDVGETRQVWRDDAAARREQRRSTVDLVRFERGEPERRDPPGDRRGP